MEEFKRNLEETNAIRSEKSSAMEDKYSQSPDPWKNGERGIYYPMMEKLVSLLLDKVDINYFLWCDIGCGGGNVGRAIHKAFHDREKNFRMYGIDISPTAIKYLQEDPNSPYDMLRCEDVESLTDEEAQALLSPMNVLSMIEVMYYLGENKPWKKTIDTIWNAIDPGTLFVVADGLISYQYREYLKSKDDAEVILEYTDMDTPVCKEVTDKGREWNRYLKVRVYRKKDSSSLKTI